MCMYNSAWVHVLTACFCLTRLRAQVSDMFYFAAAVLSAVCYLAETSCGYFPEELLRGEEMMYVSWKWRSGGRDITSFDESSEFYFAWENFCRLKPVEQLESYLCWQFFLRIDKFSHFDLLSSQQILYILQPFQHTVHNMTPSKSRCIIENDLQRQR